MEGGGGELEEEMERRLQLVGEIVRDLRGIHEVCKTKGDKDLCYFIGGCLMAFQSN